MGPSAGGALLVVRFATVLTLSSLTHVIRLSFQIICVVSDIVFFRKKVYFSPTDYENQLWRNRPEADGTSWVSKAKRFFNKPDISRSVVPLLSTVLSVVIISAIFSGTSDTYSAAENACSTKPDADISGVGVRASVWGQIAMLILISGSGHFHKKETAVKEVAGGLILTHVSLAIAIIVQMYKKTLTSVDAAIGAVILDAQNVALLIPVTAKQTLAARWQVLILIPAQIVGLVFLPVLVVKFTKGGFASQDCECLGIFWWSRLNDCDASSGDELSLFWIYYTLRWIMWIQSFFHSMYNAGRFHRSEKEGRIPILNSDGTKPETDEDKALALALELEDPDRQVTKATIQAGLLYRQYSATISVTYTTHALYSLTSMVVGEVTIAKYNLHPSSNVNSIGQIIAIVVSLATLIRVIWSFQSLYNDADGSSFPDLVFSLLCCFDAEADGTDKDSVSTSPEEGGEELGKGSDTDSRNDGSGERRLTRLPQQSSPLHHEAAGQPRQSLPHDSRPPASVDGRPSFDGIDVPKRQPYSPPEKHSRTQPTRIGQPKYSPQRHNSYKRGYRFEFRQPFHLDAVKQLFFPALTQYLEERKEEHVAAPTNETSVSSPSEPPAIDQPTASTWPGHSQGNIDKGKAPLSRSAVEVTHRGEVSDSDDNEQPSGTSGKPANLIGVKTIPETDDSDVMEQSGPSQELVRWQPQPATSRFKNPASIPASFRPESPPPETEQTYEEWDLENISSSSAITEEELPGTINAEEAQKASTPDIESTAATQRKPLGKAPRGSYLARRLRAERQKQDKISMQDSIAREQEKESAFNNLRDVVASAVDDNRKIIESSISSSPPHDSSGSVMVNAPQRKNHSGLLANIR